ncbi:MAG: hypothetical protein CUN55_07890 [Phototrophicales bacterium]|nr:MAG: hypothetical protein CUN55_07890 [Phototrophicales bacterium]
MSSQWLKFWILAFIWGSSFLLIKVAVDELGPLPLVTIRVGLSAFLFWLYMQFTHRKMPRYGEGLLPLIFVGLFNTTIPFALISFGETRIDSSLATVLNATVPLSNLVIAHFVLADERLNLVKVFGLIVGFLGIIILMSNDLRTGGSLIGQLAVLLASISYAASIVMLRLKLRHLDPFTTAGWSLIFGAIAIVPTTLITIQPLPYASASFTSIGSAIILAVINTFIAYFLFYSLIATWGVRASLVTYATPPIGVTLGVVLLGEPLDWRLIVGGMLILTGIIFTKMDNPITLWRVKRLQQHATGD